jgi:superfamily II DNA or RNA helicase
MTSAIEQLRLRDYQQRAVHDVTAAYRAGSRAILLVMPTGAGKTVTGLRFVLGAVEKRRRVLWIAHRRELVQQVADRLAREGIAHGIICDGKPSTCPLASIQIASVWTVAQSDSPPADLLVWDEAHHTVAATFRRVHARYPHAFHLGLTATPERADGTPLGDIFTTLVAPVSIPQLIADGYLVPCNVIAPKQTTGALAMDPADAVQTYFEGRQTVVFASNRTECDQIVTSLNARGIPAAFVNGTMRNDERDATLRAFAAHKIKVVVNVYILTEGWDVPDTSVCVLARKCGSVATYLQMVGRILRPAPGKSSALLVDLCGAVYQHGLPDEERSYLLTGTPIRRDPNRPSLRQCPQCGAVSRPRPVCKRCGYVFPLPEPQDIVPTEMTTVRSVPSRKELLDEWIALARICRSRVTRDGRPYSPLWASIRFKEKFGFWPPRTFPQVHEV